jgi:2-dehydro-3-deoxy-D-arabinonate dehydratase
MGVVEGPAVHDLTATDPRRFGNFAALLGACDPPSRTIDGVVAEARARPGRKTYHYADLDQRSGRSAHLLMPIEPPEVWGCGITYRQSRTAREEETKARGIYGRVYTAERPEVFFKTTAVRCVGPNQAIGIRSDSTWTVPEPELTFVVGQRGEVVGYTIGNDVSARDIEGENPLYLPQAKTFRNCCALGPTFVTPESLPDPHSLTVRCRIVRRGRTQFRGETSTRRMKRRVEELRRYLLQDNVILPGTACMTGTGIVPPDNFALTAGDLVEITIGSIGTLRNPVVQL